MKKRKLVSVILAVAVVAGTMVGCGSKDESSNSATPKKELDKSPITLTFFTADTTDDMPFTDDVAKEITKRTGVTLKITHPVGGDTQAIPLMIASGEYPDLIYAKGDTGKLIDAGALLKLNDYIDKQGDDLKKLYGDQLKRLKYSEKDPSIYTVGTYGVSSAPWDTSGTLQLQNGVLKELNYPQVKTLDDFEKALKDYKAKHPDKIGLSLMGSDWRWLITVGNTAGYVAGYPDDGQWIVDESTQTAKYKFTDPKLKDFFKWLNKLNDEKLLDPESFTQKYDQYIAKLSAGKVIGIADSTWDYGTATTSLVGAGKEDQTFAKLPVTLDANTKCPALKDYGFGGGWGIGVSANSKNKDRAFQFLNWMASDEAQVLINWGIQDKHYKMENGKRVVLPEVQKQKNTDKDFGKKTGVGQYVYPFPERGDGAKDSTGNYYTTNSPETYTANYNKAEKETLAAYKVKMWPDLFPTPKDLGGVSKHGQAYQYNIPSDSDLTVIQKKCDDYTQKAITQAILGKPADFDKAWDEIQSTLKSYNVDKANEEMSALVKEKMKLWN
ncbi:ABC transporter substrate-binding protein [Inconstantimicrobium mannanitabidum]|uniref:ABC transporter substrate-binding protein n=1 Tax=Inconstantimicrobium mannanitabidum TaxID=1604901 RepID=A0ACB5RFI3_9CLOT|nr:ABC transporter substrate-binding protein [Clostridium sp. TW13]GKX67844.1 ABC transporter substrate-binding protein [Clostridium sp. TW13]